MSDFLLNLARAAVEPDATLKPRLASRFEPLVPLDSFEARSVEPGAKTREARATWPSTPGSDPPAGEPREDESRAIAWVTHRPALDAPPAPWPDPPSGSAPPPRSAVDPPAATPLDEPARSLRPERTDSSMAGTLAARPGASALDRESADVAAEPASGLLLPSPSPLSLPRPQAALLPPAPTRAMPNVPGSPVPAPAPETTVHVTIGRIEIRAVTPGRKEKAPRADKPTGIMSLEEYVERRSGRRR